MSSINFFLAQQSAGQVAPGQNGTGQAGGSGALNNKAAFDFFKLLTGSGSELSTGNDTFDGQGNASVTTPALNAIGSATGNDKDTIANILTQLPLQKPGVDIKALSDQLDTLKNQIIAKTGDFLGDNAKDFTLINIQDQIASLKAQILSAKDGEREAPLSVLLLTGLTPSQITSLQDRVSELESKLGRDVTIEDIIAGVGGIVGFGDQNDPTDLNLDDQSDSALGFITASITQQPTTQTFAQLQSQPVSAHYEGMSARDIVNGRLAKLNAEAKIGNGTHAQGTGQNLQGGQGALLTGNGQSANNGSFFNMQDGFFIADDGVLFIDGEPTGFNIQSGLPFSSTTQASHSIAQSTQSAGTPHPATEMVSARLLQAAKGGQNQTFLLQLEPADMGKIEVRLEFGLDKMIKAVMNVEKPETFLMLQRDAHALERSLQDTGLELDGGSIDMQLAEDGSTFGQDNNGQGGGEKYGDSNQGDGEIELDEDIIQSTMTWDVDAQSGHVHYNIMA